MRCSWVRCAAGFVAGAMALAGVLLLWARHGGQGAGVPGRDLPLIFISGAPRSGSTLLRAMLHAHPEVHCSQDTFVVTDVILMYDYLMNKEKHLLDEAGVSKSVLDYALAAFCLEIFDRQGNKAPRLCDKDLDLVAHGALLQEIFPNVKFLFMVRDGRAVVHSIMSNKKKITDASYSKRDYRSCMSSWERKMREMYVQCWLLGAGRCLPVRYETLVLQPRATLRRVLAFLQLPWDEAVLHHETYVNQPQGVNVPPKEFASVQEIQPIYNDALVKWVKGFPPNDLIIVPALAPMLSILGYNPWEVPPRYDLMVDDLILLNITRKNMNTVDKY